MKIAIFDTHQFERRIFESENQKFQHDLTFFDARLTEQTVDLAAGFQCICAFVNDRLNRKVIQDLAARGTKYIALRSAGFNHVDLRASREFGIKVVRVPEYSPHAVAEHAVALILTLNRKTHRAFNRVREGNFSLDGLVGFDLFGKTVGIVGTGKIGAVLARIMKGFGCEILLYDLKQDLSLVGQGMQYVELKELFSRSDIISLHVPLNPQTHHMINDVSLALTKPGVMLINTGRGALIDSRSLIEHLKKGHIGSAGLDVYEEEEGIFFSDLSNQVLQDDVLARLLTFPNVLLTSHQAFLTNEALKAIAQTTLFNMAEMRDDKTLTNEVFADVIPRLASH